MKKVGEIAMLIVTITVNFFLVQFLYWGFVYGSYSSPLISSLFVAALFAVLATTVVMIFRLIKNKPFFRIAPITSGGISIILIISILISESVRPDSTYIYGDGEYQYKEESWHDDDGYIIKVRRSSRSKGGSADYLSSEWEVDTEFTQVPFKVKGY